MTQSQNTNTAYWIGDPLLLSFITKQDLEVIAKLADTETVLKGGAEVFLKDGVEILVYRPFSGTGMYPVRRNGILEDSIPNDSYVFAIIPMYLLEDLDMGYLDSGYWWETGDEIITKENVKDGIFKSNQITLDEVEPV